MEKEELKSGNPESGKQEAEGGMQKAEGGKQEAEGKQKQAPKPQTKSEMDALAKEITDGVLTGVKKMLSEFKEALQPASTEPVITVFKPKEKKKSNSKK